MTNTMAFRTTLDHMGCRLAEAADGLATTAAQPTPPRATAPFGDSARAHAGRDAGTALGAPDARSDRLTAVFGHEIRGRIAPMKNAASLLRCAPGEVATVLKVADLIDRQVDGMIRLVDELLVTQSETLRPRPRLRRADIGVETLVKLGVECVEPLASLRRQVLRVRMPAAACVRLAADEMWLGQALQNVLGNAVKYTDPGGRIDVEVTHDSANAVISVRDTGVGLAPPQLETVFDWNTRVAQPATRSPVGGIGVGLYVARWVIEAHGGSIHAESAGLGHGTTFVIRLPCWLAEPLTAPVALATSSPVRGTATGTVRAEQTPERSVRSSEEVIA